MQKLLLIGLVSGALMMSPGLRNAAADEERAQGTPFPKAQELKDTGRRDDQTAEELTAQHRALLSDGSGGISSRLDFSEMAKVSLGVEWYRRTPKERTEFVKLFADFLEKAVIRRLEPYSNPITYPADGGDEPYTKVGCTLQTPRGGEIHISYLLYRLPSEWKIYDVIIEDVSLVRNYHAQFNHVISTSSYEALVHRLEQKVSEFDGEATMAG